MTVVAGLLLAVTGFAQKPSDTSVSQMEKLDRGLVVIPMSTSSVFVSWRLLGTDDVNTTFQLLKNGQVVKDNIYGATSLTTSGKATDEFQVVTMQNGMVTETSELVKPWEKSYLELKLDRPAGGSGYEYTPNDCSVGDVNGDGQYEIFVKWDPTNSKDNSQDGVTGYVYIDCYKLDGTKLWRINLGRNIRAGAHYTQYMVYDFDGDGKAELMCKTAPGSKDGTDKYVNQAATDSRIKNADNSKSWITSSGRMDGGHEYLTVFNGLTGEAVHTIAYNPNRNAETGLSEAQGTFNWAVGKTDNHGYNRGDRYLAAVAYLDGKEQPASAVFCRGYYTYAFLWAVSFDGVQLHERWLHASRTGFSYELTTYDAAGNGSKTTYSGLKPTSGSGSGTMFQNGNHNLSVADVDGDGCDEILWGSGGVDHDGKLLYGTGFGHGDAIHLSDLNPDRPGYEVFQIHEEKGPTSWDVHDAATGEIIWKGGQSGIDNGRGLAADIVPTSRGFEFWSSYGGNASDSRDMSPYNVISNKLCGSKQPSMNFRIYWDGDVYDELLDGITISKYSPTADAEVFKLVSGRGSNGNPQSCNSTKSTPNLSADIFGDWREELILWSGNDSSTLNIYSTFTNTNYRVPTLMHDHVYRLGICWQNVAYNQPPHLGYYLPDYIESFQGLPTAIHSVEAETVEVDDAWYTLQGVRIDSPKVKGVYVHNGRKVVVD